MVINRHRTHGFHAGDAKALRQSRLVLTRAGGLVINEIPAFELPSILVPLPFAKDHHQIASAYHAALQGASHQTDQTGLPELPKIIRELFVHPERLAARPANARRDAAEVIVERIDRHVKDRHQ